MSPKLADNGISEFASSDGYGSMISFRENGQFNVQLLINMWIYESEWPKELPISIRKILRICMAKSSAARIDDRNKCIFVTERQRRYWNATVCSSRQHLRRTWHSRCQSSFRYCELQAFNSWTEWSWTSGMDEDQLPNERWLHRKCFRCHCVRTKCASGRAVLHIQHNKSVDIHSNTVWCERKVSIIHNWERRTCSQRNVYVCHVLRLQIGWCHSRMHQSPLRIFDSVVGSSGISMLWATRFLFSPDTELTNGRRMVCFVVVDRNSLNGSFEPFAILHTTQLNDREEEVENTLGCITIHELSSIHHICIDVSLLFNN